MRFLFSILLILSGCTSTNPNSIKWDAAPDWYHNGHMGQDWRQWISSKDWNK